MASVYFGTDDEFAFGELLDLPDEFNHIPASEFPFKELTQHDVWREFAICTKMYCDPSGVYLVRGNYLAAKYLRETRLEAKKKERGICLHLSVARRLLEFPVEIILEVFGHLHPVDLLTLIRTTKFLRSLLLSRGSVDVWTHAFANYEDVPPVPEGMSPPRWTTILYGPPNCDSCKLYPAMVDFTYCDRLCEKCSIDQSYTSDQVSRMVGHLPGGVNKNYFRSTYKFYAMLYPSIYATYNAWSARYRIRDVEEFQIGRTAHEGRIYRGDPEAQLLFDKFLQERSQIVEDEYRIRERYTRWAEDAWQDAVAVCVDVITEIIQNWEKRLVNIGHHPSDVQLRRGLFVQLFRKYYIFNVRQGKKGFNRCRRELEQAVQANVFLRKEAERALRANQVLESYDAMVLHNLPPSLWKSAPPKDSVLSLGPISQYVNGGHPRVSHWANIPGTVQLLDQFVLRWLSHSEIPVFWGLVAAGYDICENDVRTTLSTASMSVFSCSNHPREVLVGWENIVPHIRCALDDTGTWHSSCPEISFSVSGHDIVNSLTSSIGKPPDSTSIADMDQANPVFVCGDCTLQYGMRGTVVYRSFFFTWRQAVLHGVLEEPSHRNFTQVVEETRQYVIGRQKPFPDPLDLSWVCNYCSEHHCQPVKRSKAVAHLGKWHGLRNPKSGTDVLYIGGWNPPPPIVLTREPSECHICLLCPLAQHPKLYHAASVKMHLAAKHNVTTPVEGTHWKHLEIPSIAPRHH